MEHRRVASLIDLFPLSYYPLSPTDRSSEEPLHALLQFGYCKGLGGHITPKQMPKQALN